jgi:glycosyltransferase involved in cell wall biosynthesis
MLNKIMFFLPTLGGGGAERTVIQLANNLVQQGRDVDVVVCDLTGEKAKLLPEVDAQIQLIDLNCGRVSNAIMPLKKLLQAIAYDAVVATQTHSNIICALAKRLAKSQSKLILREVSTPSKNMKLTGLKKFVFNRLVNWTYTAADQIVCVSHGVLEDFRGYYGYQDENLSTIYNPVIDSSYLQKLKAPVQHRFFSAGHQVVLAVGRLTEAKNFGLLIRAFYDLHQQHPETRLIILGEGELRREFEALIAELNLTDVVDLPGFDPNPYAYFKYASLFVLSSNWEGLPGVLIQALASKVKVVSTDCPSGPREILAEGQFGLLVPCDDQQGLSHAMHQALYHEYVEFDAQAFKQHCLQFHKDTVVRQYRELLESEA